MATPKKNKPEKVQKVAFEADSEDREEHIRALELTVQYLKGEIDSLKSQLSDKTNYSALIPLSASEKSAMELTNCKSEAELLDKTHAILAKYYSAVESNFYIKTDNGDFHPLNSSEAPSQLDKQIYHLEEQGILDWVFEEKSLKVIPNLDETANKQSSLIIYPIFSLDKPIGVFLAGSALDSSLFSSEMLGSLANSLGVVCATAHNMLVIREKSSIQNKFEIISSQLMQTSLLMSVGEIAGTISREMESPIKIIQANNDLIQRGIGNVERRSEIIAENLARLQYLNTIIKELIFDDAAEPEIASINKLMMDTIDILQFQISSEDIRINIECEKSELYVECFRSQIQHVLLNLFLNARDAMPNGGNLTVGCFRHGDKKVSISIADTGEGIAEKDFPNIFEPHFTKKTGSKKLALNLYMTKLIINQHKGKISFVSEQGKGSTFKIILPLAKH